MKQNAQPVCCRQTRALIRQKMPRALMIQPEGLGQPKEQAPLTATEPNALPLMVIGNKADASCS